LIATADEGVNEIVLVNASYAGLNVSDSVTVSNISVGEFPILPPWERTLALIQDTTVLTIIIATLVSIVATRASTSFGGVGAFYLVLVIGWIMGWVDTGIVLAGLILALFLGLNLAANIDYQINRGQ